MTRSRARAGKALLLFGTLLLSLGVCEIALRAAGRLQPRAAAPLGLPGLSDAAQPFSRPDDLLIYSIVPHARTYDWYAIDAHGFRTPEFPAEKPPGAFRIVVTGDSTTFGLGVLEEQRWSSVLRRALAGLCGDVRAIEVINAGVPGYSTLQNRLQIERDLLSLHPDLLLLLVTGGNDATLVEGPDDAGIVAAQHSLAGRLAGLRVAQMFGATSPAYGAPPPKALPGSLTARSRVSPSAAEENLRAIAELLPGRVVFAIFQSQTQRAESADVDGLAERVAAIAAERDLPLADVRPRIEELLPFPLYLDGIHPTPLGHELIARTVLEALLARLDLPAARAAWVAAFFDARAQRLASRAATLAGPGAPPRFTELLALCAESAAASPDARANVRADAPPDALPEPAPIALPDAMRDWDPLSGRRCAARSASRLLLAAAANPSGSTAADAARLTEIRTFVRPEDPLLACFENEQHLLAASEPLRSLGRALIVFAAELGLPPVRADLRRGEAAQATDPAAAVTLLDAVLALDPGDDEARYDRAFDLRRAGRREEAREEFSALAAGSGPLADFARGLLAFEAGDLAAAEPALRGSIRGAPALGNAHHLLGRVLLAQDRLDEAVPELVLASVLLGTVAELPAALAQIDARRAQLAAPAAIGDH